MICIDSNVLLSVLHPDATMAPAAEISACDAIMREMQRGKIQAVAPSVFIMEVAWISGRLYEHNPEEIAHDQLDSLLAAFPSFLGDNFQLVSVDSYLASEAALYRLKHYSRKAPMSYNDALFMATALVKECKYLVTTDRHLLNLEEQIKILTPSEYVDQ